MNIKTFFLAVMLWPCFAIGQMKQLNSAEIAQGIASLSVKGSVLYIAAHPDDEKPHLTAGIDAHTAWVMSGVAWPELDADKAQAAALRASRGDLSSYTDVQLVERARLVQSQLPHLFSQHVVSGSSAAVAPGLLGVVAEAIGEPSLPMALLSSIGDVDSADANYALWNLSRMVHNDADLSAAFDAGINDDLFRIHSPFTDAWNEFIVEFGSRGPDEWDLRSPTWETHPQLLLAGVEAHAGRRGQNALGVDLWIVDVGAQEDQEHHRRGLGRAEKAAPDAGPAQRRQPPPAEPGQDGGEGRGRGHHDRADAGRASGHREPPAGLEQGDAHQRQQQHRGDDGDQAGVVGGIGVGDALVVRAPGMTTAQAGQRVAVSLPADALHVFDDQGLALTRTVDWREHWLAVAA